ncbi:MAG: carbohydrate-binding domain-containing protein, partial [Clostridiales bacterium]|nr:carbohydrate-binding domain-containing protein [Clostridiales bacterium]
MRKPQKAKYTIGLLGLLLALLLLMTSLSVHGVFASEGEEELETIEIEEMENINAGLRLPMGFVPAASGTATLYFINSSGNFYDNAAGNGSPVALPQGTWAWNAGTSTLTLSGLEWTTTAQYALYFPHSLTLHLTAGSVNTFTSTYSATTGDVRSAGIYAAAGLTIEGTGILTAVGGTVPSVTPPQNRSAGIYINNGKLIINDGTVTAGGGPGYKSSGLFNQWGAIEINGGSVTANAGQAYFESAGISADGGVEVNGGRVLTKGGNTTGGFVSTSAGFYSWGGSIDLNGGVFTAQGNTQAIKLDRNDSGVLGVLAFRIADYDWWYRANLSDPEALGPHGGFNTGSIAAYKYLKFDVHTVLERYLVYLGTPASGTLWGSAHWLADAVVLCSQDNTLYTIVATDDDYDMSDGAAAAIIIPANKKIVLTSDQEGPYKIIQTSVARHLLVAGELTASNITFEGLGLPAGSGAHITNGGILVSGAEALFTMENGTSIKKCYGENGGGVEVGNGAFVMNDGEISANIAGTGNGGGIYVNGGNLTVKAGAIKGNKAALGHGGGIFTVLHSHINIWAPVIFSGNIASAGVDLKNTQQQYTTIFPTIASPFGQHYSYPSDSPVNNYDINVRQITITVHYIDTNHRPLTAPPPISATAKAYSVPETAPFALDGTNDRIVPDIGGYIFVNWALYQPALTVDNTTVWMGGSPMNVSIFLIYKEISETTVTVSKTITGTYANKNRTFAFTVSFYADADGLLPLPANTTFPCTGGTLTLDAQGSDTVHLQHGQSVT